MVARARMASDLVYYGYQFVSMTSSKSACVYCGDTPTNHPIHFIDAGITTIVTSLRTPREKPVLQFFDFERSEVFRITAAILLHLLELLHIVTYSDDLSKTKSHRTESIWKEAQRRGIRMQEVLVFGLRRDIERAWLPVAPGSEKHRWYYFESIPIPPWLNQYGLGWVDDKYSLKKVFTKHRLPIPRGRAVLTARGAHKVLRDLGTAVITKPREGSRGRHTTVEITTPEELTAAFMRAQQLCPFVLVEEFIPGRVYRASCIGKKVIGIMELVRPTVVADGVQTIAELREYHNKHTKKFPSLTDVEDTNFFRSAIRHQGYTLESVPPKGTEVLLAEFSERTNGGYFIDCTDEVPSTTIEVIERAAAACGVDLVGFDIISKDLTDPTERFVVIEGNTLPYIEIHDIPYAGKVRNVSGAVFDLWK